MRSHSQVIPMFENELQIATLRSEVNAVGLFGRKAP